MESKNTDKSSLWHKESMVGLIAAIGSLVAAVLLAHWATSTWITATVLLSSISLVLALVAALTKIRSIHITFEGKKNKPRKTR